MLIALYALWIILNGKITSEIFVIGLLLIVLIGLFINKGLFFGIRSELEFYRKLGLFFCFSCVLVWEILKANIRMIDIVFNKNHPVKQTLVHFNVDLKRSFALSLLANAITLTPGTITVKQEGGHFIVHCLDRHMIDGIQDGSFMRLLKKMEA